MPVFHLLRNNLLCHREQRDKDSLADMLNHAMRRAKHRPWQLQLYGYWEWLGRWLPWWPLCLDDQWEKYGGGESVKLSAQPSESRRQCLIGTDVYEELLQVVIDDIGDDNIVKSVDYPHADGRFPHGLETFLALLGVNIDSKRKIMWDNGVRLYGFPEEALFAHTES